MGSSTPPCHGIPGEQSKLQDDWFNLMTQAWALLMADSWSARFCCVAMPMQTEVLLCNVCIKSQHWSLALQGSSGMTLVCITRRFQLRSNWKASWPRGFTCNWRCMYHRNDEESSVRDRPQIRERPQALKRLLEELGCQSYQIMSRWPSRGGCCRCEDLSPKKDIQS